MRRLAKGFVAIAIGVGLMWGESGAQIPVLGMNIVNPLRRSVAQQDATIAQLKAAGVRVVRFGVEPNDKALDLVKRLDAAGIKVEMIVNPEYPASAPSRAYQPEKYPDMWGGHPLSTADAELSKAKFQALMDRLDAMGIVAEAFELGNEINWTAFNPEFPLPGEGKIFSYDDLGKDAEAKKIAQGFDQYIKIAAVLREARDGSKLNKGTPIVSAGLSDPGPARTVPGGKEDAVSINATIQYLRGHGIDRYVDGYGVHVYLWQPNSQARAWELQNFVTAKCGNGGPGQPKPCWVTEWGFKNTSTACPLDDRARSALVGESMAFFEATAKQRRLKGAIYFSWDTDAYSKQLNPDTVFRCGSLTEAGRVALGLR